MRRVIVILLIIGLMSSCAISGISKKNADKLLNSLETCTAIDAEIISDSVVALEIANAIYVEQYNSSELIDNENAVVWEITKDNSFIVNFPTSDPSIDEWGVSFKFDGNTGELINHWYS